MGARNVKAIFTDWPELGNRAFRALVYVAVTTLDDGNRTDGRPTRTYWAGWEPLARALGLDVDAARAIGDDDKRRRKIRDIKATVSRAVAELVDAGALVRVTAPVPGRRAVYRLVIVAEGSGDGSNGWQDDDNGWRSCQPNGWHERHPKDQVPGSSFEDSALERARAHSGRNDADDIGDAFEAFWQTYPRPMTSRRKQARRAFAEAIADGVDPAVIVEGARRAADIAADRFTDEQFIAEPHNWLRHRRWEDEDL